LLASRFSSVWTWLEVVVTPLDMSCCCNCAVAVRVGGDELFAATAVFFGGFTVFRAL
jgi:hypothetical protein